MDLQSGYHCLGRLTSKLSSSLQGRGGDRFIPNRSAMDFDFADYMLMSGLRKEDDKASKGAYMEILDRVIWQNRTRILEFNSKPPTRPEETFPAVFMTSPSRIKSIPKKISRYVPQSADRTLDAPYIENDFYLNLLDWGKKNIVAIALENSVYLWNDSSSSVLEFVQYDPNEDFGPVSSVSWAPNGQHLAIGLSNSQVQLWDIDINHPLRTFEGIHQSRVGSLAWNDDNTLTTGGNDGNILSIDVRIRPHIVQVFRGHNMEVCGLKWSGNKLASGGDDNRVHVWDSAMAASPSSSFQNRWLHRFEDHTAAVKGLAWCPFQRNLLASGGGNNDRCIKFWNTETGNCLNSINTGSQVCGLVWSKKEKEILSSHGQPHNQLTLWNYPSMKKIVDLSDHSSPVLFIAQSPNGCKVASAGADETLRFWKIYETSTMKKHVSKGARTIPFASLSGITTIR